MATTLRPTSIPSTDGVTVIGGSVLVRGTLSGDEDLHVLGRVDGRVELQRTLIVAQSGIVKAEVSVKNAIVSGVVVGNIHASESVEITREGRMVGDIFAPRVIIVDGASFRGNVDMGDIANMPQRKPQMDRPRPMPMPARPQPRPMPAAAPRPAAAPMAAPAPRSQPSTPPRPVSVPPTPVPQAAPEPEAEPEMRSIPDEPPEAKGLPSKQQQQQQQQQKQRVIVKRK